MKHCDRYVDEWGGSVECKDKGLAVLVTYCGCVCVCVCVRVGCVFETNKPRIFPTIPKKQCRVESNPRLSFGYLTRLSTSDRPVEQRSTI